MKRPWFVKYLFGVALFQVTSISLYWILWFTMPDFIRTFPPQSPEYSGYVSFEQAFLLADAFLVCSALLIAIGFWKMWPWAYFLAVLNAGGLMFLGCMDLLYDLQHSVFSPMTGGGAVELGIVLMTFGLDFFNIWIFWTKRQILFPHTRTEDQALQNLPQGTATSSLR